MSKWLVFRILVICLVVAYTVGAFFPSPLMEAKNTLKSLVKDYNAYLQIKPTNQLRDSTYDGAGVTINESGKTQPGNTFMAGFFDNAPSLRLIKPDGELIHEWKPDIGNILTTQTHIKGKQIPFNNWFYDIHGAALLPDGGVAFNVSNYIFVKMNVCGEVEWTVPYMGHHVVFAAEDNTYWVASRNFHDKKLEKYPGLKAPFWEDTVIQVDDKGTLLREISVLDVFEKNDLWGQVFAGHTPHPTTGGDFTHLNNVDVLDSKRAHLFPGLDAGDVMMSIRNPNLVVIFDPDTLEVKWSQTGPWVRQHDPDFTDTGEIAVYDNRNDGMMQKGHFGGSRIVMIKPEVPMGGEVRIAFQNSEETPFFSPKQGTVNVLENQNMLITETHTGRVFEVTPDGEVVWTYINAYDDNKIASVIYAERVASDYAISAIEACK